MKVIVSENAQQLGKKAAELTAQYLREAIAEKGSARIILSTGASQFTTLEALVKEDVDWSKVEMFHLDEYVNLPQDHPASFVRYLKERFVEKTGGLKAVHFVDTSIGTDAIIEKLTGELKEAVVDVGLIGIGENAHVAFNDPPVADFQDPKTVKIVELDPVCRQQQVNDGCFATLEEVPHFAYTLTIPTLLKARWMFGMVPGPTKIEAVDRAVNGPVSTQCPASILRSHPRAVLYLDEVSAQKLR